MKTYLVLCPLLLASLSCVHADAPASNPKFLRQSEKLGRGTFALVEDGGKVWVSWRLWPGEEKTGFNLYRSDGNKTLKLNAAPLSGATNFEDARADLTRENRYFVRALAANGKEAEADKGWVVKANTLAQPYLSIPLQTPEAMRQTTLRSPIWMAMANTISCCIKPGAPKTTRKAAKPIRRFCRAYKLDGTLLWTINLGKNIREGAHYTQFMVYDLDGDGRAEIVCKTADGTVDGAGKVIGDAKAELRQRERAAF